MRPDALLHSGRLVLTSRFLGETQPSMEAAYARIAQNATNNALGQEVVLGRFVPNSSSSYIAVAESRGATYFNIPRWEGVQRSVGTENIWNINKAFMEQQRAAGKTFLLSHNPELAPAGSFFEREVAWLREAGYDFVRDGDLWRATVSQ